MVNHIRRTVTGRADKNCVVGLASLRPELERAASSSHMIGKSDLNGRRERPWRRSGL